MTAALELAEDPLGGHLPLQVLDRALDPLVADGDLEGLALNGFGRHLNFPRTERALAPTLRRQPARGGAGISQRASDCASAEPHDRWRASCDGVDVPAQAGAECRHRRPSGAARAPELS